MLPQYNLPQYSDQHYAVVDLGSNSFHLLISQVVNGKISTINKIKQKIRLAAGLNSQNQLNTKTINKGLECLTLFAQHLTNIPTSNIRIVATATLRIAENRQDFLDKANTILPVPIELISGNQEAALIYSGVASTSFDTSKRLVIDIGGASTELIVGEGDTAHHCVSLNIGCVSFDCRYFSNGHLSERNFETAIQAAKDIIRPQADGFISQGWQHAVGSSGIVQALTEISGQKAHVSEITPILLQEVKQTLIEYEYIKAINFDGLRADRAAVLASGLSILIALFECLSITSLSLSKGALREGLLFGMLP